MVLTMVCNGLRRQKPGRLDRRPHRVMIPFALLPYRVHWLERTKRFGDQLPEMSCRVDVRITSRVEAVAEACGLLRSKARRRGLLIDDAKSALAKMAGHALGKTASSRRNF